jgi:hypothetical protein
VNELSLRLGTATIALLCSGCAQFTNYTRPIDLREGSVAIDVKQRVVFSQGRNDLDGNGRPRTSVVVCAEPSPDALTVLGASGGLSINSGTGKAGNASAAFAESGASIGLRTQSIQLLRDAMYRLCEGYAAGAVSDSDFAAMQRRYQSTMMGLIAIEQLTGPIVAAQAMLTSSGVAQAGASAGNAAVDTAQAKLDLASEARLRAQTELEASQGALDGTRADIKAVNQKISAEKAKKEPDQSVMDALGERLSTLTAQEKTQQGDLADKKRRLDWAESRRSEARADLASAKASVASTAGGAGRLGDVAGATRDSNVAFAKAVQEIVGEINRSYSRDGCLTLLTELARTGGLKGAPSSTVASATEVEKAQKRVVELEGEVARAQGVGEEMMASRPDQVPLLQRLDAAEKFQRAKTDLGFARDNLKRAQEALAQSQVSAKVVGGTTTQAVEVCQSILAAEKRRDDETRSAPR